MSKHTGFVRQKGLLIVISGFSGAGKSTIVKRLTQRENYAYSVSATTRAPREGEEEGKDYFFVTVPEFESYIRNQQLLEYNCYVGNYYGTPKEYVLKKIDEGKDVILEIDVHGAMNIKKNFPEAVLIFVTAPDAKTLTERLINRGSESQEIIHKRLSEALEEADSVPYYDYLMINDDLEETVDHMDRLIQDQHMRTGQQDKFVCGIVSEIKNVLKIV